MELIKCKNGHTYDPSVTPQCPECERQGTLPLYDNGFQQMNNLDKTMPLGHDTVPVNVASGSSWADEKDYVQAGAASDRYDPTMPINYDDPRMQNMAAQPIAGWLVCIDGPDKGRDFRLHEENNYIGRSAQMDVCIPGDPTISRENHAIIAYDNVARAFYFAPVSGASIVRHNGKAVLSMVELKQGDRVQIGKGTFLFVPLCGENFQWNM